MIDALSPFSRRIIAIALLLLAIVTLLNLIIVPLWQACAGNIAELSIARARIARMEAIAATQPPEQGDSVPATAMIISPSREGAIATLTGSIGASASRTKVTGPSITPAPPAGAPAKVAVDIDASGSEVDLVAFLADIEAASPAIRLQSWSVEAPLVVGTPAHVRGRAVAVWAARP
ncbi:hypothetical protein SAMN05444678_12054 [Sphingomonas sp. YR710]|uniref:GspMb/PilO family protein n=1 Tax=Sphingomonas sp. YR710 TaxID=1882773 RepID=UPI00088C3601|nr:hypothetical protein [Sphingomonas sp. YR710]SDD73188.1 hypothetical protein SAMN05444678_12054 [Sphingomonas sp. YR710]